MKEYEDFYLELWGNVSSQIVPEEFARYNSEFINAITFDMYRNYEMSGGMIDISVFRRNIVSIFFNLKNFKICFADEVSDTIY